MLCVSYAAWDDNAPNYPSIRVEVNGSVSVVHDGDVLNMDHWGPCPRRRRRPSNESRMSFFFFSVACFTAASVEDVVGRFGVTVDGDCQVPAGMKFSVMSCEGNTRVNMAVSGAMIFMDEELPEGERPSLMSTGINAVLPVADPAVEGALVCEDVTGGGMEVCDG
jgi:hypothetical protein